MTIIQERISVVVLCTKNSYYPFQLLFICYLVVTLIFKDNRSFLIPWIVCVSMATLLDIFLCFYFTAKDSSDPFHTVLFITDFLFSTLNVSI
ncbi:UNVERIFIED_CONTAM: hypothetical protein NCL1_28900 [Trichonephila clavipes]